MSYALAAALCASLAGWAFTVHLFLRYVTQVSQDASIERAQLCQRIQAPDAAVVAHDRPSNGDIPVPQPSGLFSDNAFWASQGIDIDATPED